MKETSLVFHNFSSLLTVFTIDHPDSGAYIHITSREIPAGSVLCSRGK
jgi:hypothetical protein